MKLAAYLGLGLIDFIIGVVFGSIGHFFSLLCFPFMALIRAVLTILIGDGVKLRDRDILISSTVGAGAFYLGLVIGVTILIFIIVPAADNAYLNQTLSRTEGKIGGFLGGAFCGIVYVLIYMLIAGGIPFLYKYFSKK